MKTQPHNHNRVLWHDFKKTGAYKYTQYFLRAFGYRLVVKFGRDNIADDCYVETIPRTASTIG